VGVPNVGGVGKNCVFRLVKKSPAETPYLQKFVSICHGGPCPRPCTGGGICGVINIIADSPSLLITVMVQLTSTMSAVDDMHGPLHNTCIAV